jgi:predicted ester cyclase
MSRKIKYLIMEKQDNKQFMNSFIEEVINRQNLDAIDKMASEDFIEHVPFPGQGPGREGLKFAIGSMHTGFPDMNWTTLEQIAEGEKVVSRFVWRGIHNGEFMGIPPTNKKVEVWGIVIDVVKDGLFSESRIIMDNVGLLQQLGVMPGPQVE